jgi:hypothetical protein
VRHPSFGELLELHFEESSGAEREALAAHVRDCTACQESLEELRGLERALSLGPDDAPPSDGLERVLARVARGQPALAFRREWVRAAVPSAAALLTGAWAIHAAAQRLSSLGLVPATLAGSVSGDLLVLSLAALAVVGAGALVTLAVAPVLILESHGRS